MIVAVVTMRMVQVTGHDVVHVISVPHRLVTAVRPVLVLGLVVVAVVIGCNSDPLKNCPRDSSSPRSFLYSR